LSSVQALFGASVEPLPSLYFLELNRLWYIRSMAWSSDSAAWLAIKKQVRQQEARVRQRLAKMKQSRRDRINKGIASTPHAEQMQCPKCKVKYAFGNECPTCEVALVGDAFSEVDTSHQEDVFIHESEHFLKLAAFMAIGFLALLGLVHLFDRAAYW
jgi:hypothetical protein